MAKRLSNKPGAIDIFSDGRLDEAMAAATAPVVDDPEPQTTLAAKLVPIRAPKREEPASQTVEAPTANTAAKPTSADAAPRHIPREEHVGFKWKIPRALKGEFLTFIAQFASALEVHLEDSNVGRALLEQFLVEDSERILSYAQTHRGTLHRPHKGDHVGMAEFDQRIGDIIREGRKKRRSAPRTTDELG